MNTQQELDIIEMKKLMIEIGLDHPIWKALLGLYRKKRIERIIYLSEVAEQLTPEGWKEVIENCNNDQSFHKYKEFINKIIHTYAPSETLPK